MKQIPNRRILTWAACLFPSLIASAVIGQDDIPTIEIGLQCIVQENLSDLIVTLRNSGNSDTAIVIGETRGNGQVYLADALSVGVRVTGDPADYIFPYFQPDFAFTVGRVDPWIVPLPARSSFSITIKSDHFSSSDLRTKLKDMTEIAEIYIHLAAREIDFVNADTTGLALMHLSVGDMQSTPLVFPSSCMRNG